MDTNACGPDLICSGSASIGLCLVVEGGVCNVTPGTDTGNS